MGVLAIAGLPPLNGYVSLGLIHDALRSTGQGLPFAAMILAQVLTMAALGKAAWQAFYRPRQPDDEFERDERLRPGMVAGLVALSGGCIALGVFPQSVLRHIADPAVGALLDPAGYARGVLGGGGVLHVAELSFDYVSPVGILTVIGTAIAAAPVAMAGIRWSTSSPVAFVRRIQSGSVNDYAGFLAIGLLVSVAVLGGRALF